MGCELTSLISLILEPPLPMRLPHWLAGIMRRTVTGGLGSVLFCSACSVLMSYSSSDTNNAPQGISQNTNHNCCC